jgi:starch synthase
MPAEPLRVLYATPECAPIVKTGGLGDVSGALPRALRRLGIDARVLLPAYRGIAPVAGRVSESIALPATAGLPEAKILPFTAAEDLPGYLVHCPALYDRPGSPYQDPSGKDWEDNALRFAQLARAAAHLGRGEAALSWRAQVVHGNDWQVALAAAYLAYAPRPHAGTLVTIHNLAFQGIFPAERFPALGLPPESFSIRGLEYHGQVSFMKAGIAYADAISTVSPTYAEEIRRAPLGFGLEGLLAERGNVLTGILNGIDTGIWNPATDPRIARRYDAETLEKKAENKAALQSSSGLALEPATPVLGIVSRFTEQKGLDLVLEAAERIVSLPAQLVALGSGDSKLEEGFARLARKHPEKVRATIGFDEALAHRIEAGADLFLMPSRFEPCGMNQMYSQRYGTLPVVRATGGLADSVADGLTGFTFQEPSAPALLAAIERALEAYRNAELWKRLQRQAMAREFGWEASARRYAALYAQIMQPVSNG